jgi:hypothetical protein
MVYTICAKEFGWTPSEVDEIDAVTLESILTAIEKIKEKEARATK